MKILTKERGGIKGMRKKILITFLVLILILGGVPLKTFAQTSNAVQFAEKTNVSIDKVWTVTVSKNISDKDISSIKVTDSNNVSFPVALEVKGNKVSVSPVNTYKAGTKYLLTIILSNGKVYSMNFTTAGIIREPNEPVFNIKSSTPVSELQSTNDEPFNNEFEITNILEKGKTLEVDVRCDVDTAAEAYKLAFMVKQSFLSLNNDQIQEEMATNINSTIIVINGSVHNWVYKEDSTICEVY